MSEPRGAPHSVNKMTTPETPSAPGKTEPTIRLDNVSRYYGEVLGINKISVDIFTGITGLVGPNGSGKSTLMNIICGMIRADQGSATVLGQPVWNNLDLRRRVGYCTQIDHFYERFSGLQFLESVLSLHGRDRFWSGGSAIEALEQVNLLEDKDRTLATYSKGMRQRIKVALAIAHQPDILVLDEPFNGLDPVGRRQMMQLFGEYSREGRTVLISSHILHEIEQMTDQILMMSNGYVVAEGQVQDVRELLRSHPFKILVRCSDPRRLAALMFAMDGVSSVQMEDEDSMILQTADPDDFYLRFNEVILENEIEVHLVTMADENVQSIYQYLSGREHH